MGGQLTCKNKLLLNNFFRINSTKKLERRLVELLKNDYLCIIIELSPDDDYHKRKQSAHWMTQKLIKINCKLNVIHKILHYKKGEFYIYIEKNLERKIIFSNSTSHVDTVNGTLVNKKNYSLILSNIIKFLKQCK
jgi:hypothetical protein